MTNMNKNPYKLCVAPMMGHTDLHFRYLLRLISKKTMLYTEMVASNAILHNKSQKFNKLLHIKDEPVGFQLGGDSPAKLAQCAQIVESHGYNEINLNIGCPSKRAQSGNFGACLFDQPKLVASCVREISRVTNLPITVKTRLGIDNIDNIKHLQNFINIVSSEGVSTFHLHARKAILKKGINPRKNRSVPPINYERVYDIKNIYPDLKIVLNGEISTPTEVVKHLKYVDGVMIGRAVCNNPFLLNDIDVLIHNEQKIFKEDILEEYFKYITNNFTNELKITDFTKHLSCIFKGYIGSKHTRAYMCHELNFEKEPVKKLEELIFKEDLWKDGQDSITTVI